jgi:hypothetical protein
MKTGDKVVYIGSGDWYDITTGNLPIGPTPIRNEIYTVSGIHPATGRHIFLREITWIDESGEQASWEATSFRPVDDTFGEVVAEIIEKQIEVEQMETV